MSVDLSTLEKESAIAKPRRYPDLRFDRIYQFRFSGVPQERKQAVWREIATWVFELFGRPEKVLDPACGQLEFLSYCPAKEAWGVDLQPPPKPTGNATTKFNLIQGNVFDVELPRDYFDLVYISNFLEHLQSPEEAQFLLMKMKDALKPGGQIVIMGPNFRYAAKEYFDCADHKLIFTDMSVSELLFAAGFTIKNAWDRFLPYSFRSKMPSHPLLVRLYLRLPFAWKIFGKQFLIVGSKP